MYNRWRGFNMRHVRQRLEEARIPWTGIIRYHTSCIDGRPSQPGWLFQNVPIELAGKTVMIDMEIVHAPLDYNYLSPPMTN